MQRDAVIATIQAHRSGLQRFGVRSLALFGSIARDEARSDSDIDLLVEFQGSATFDAYMGLKLFLEDILGAPVDLVTTTAVKPRLRPLIERDLLRVA